MESRWAAIIVAGGQSERMGQAKAWLDLDGRPLLEHVVDEALAVCPRVIVVGSPGQSLPELDASVLRLDDPPERAHSGPLSGVSVGLEALRTSADLAYLGSCDAPYVTRDHIRFVLQTLASGSKFAAVVPETGPDDEGRRILHGLCGAVRVPEGHRTAGALLQADRRSLAGLYTALPTRRLGVAELPDPRAIRDCNSPDQWEAALAELSPVAHQV